MAELITVMAAKVNGWVVLWEKAPDHPGGEAFVAGDGRSVQVALTQRVQKHLDAGTLIKVQVADNDPPSTGSGSTGSPTGEPTGAVPEPVEGPPFADYDTLAATAIIERLPTLADAERDAVRVYEAAHKNRVSILKALG